MKAHRRASEPRIGERESRPRRFGVPSKERKKPLRNNNVLRRRLHPILEALSIREGGLHGFRHGRVSFLVENDTPVEVIKAWIGHGSERIVRLYSHLRPQHRSRVLASIPSLVSSKVAVIDALPPLLHIEKVA